MPRAEHRTGLSKQWRGESDNRKDCDDAGQGTECEPTRRPNESFASGARWVQVASRPECGCTHPREFRLEQRTPRMQASGRHSWTYPAIRILQNILHRQEPANWPGKNSHLRFRGLPRPHSQGAPARRWKRRDATITRSRVRCAADWDENCRLKTDSI